MSRRYPDAPRVGIGIVVLRGEAVLLVRRGQPPAQGAWSLPGGGQELGETAEAAARRELVEETGLTVGALWLAGAVDSIHRNTEGRIEYHYTILDFAADYQGGDARPGGDVSAVAWVAEAEFDAYELWAEARRIIALARRR
ncbi:MAG: phosphohydrolase [Acidiphilium sp. 37-64-53]|uniref:NUDIX hydrolase n=1 Tax=Acidiphilium TaxID=522 RepID=UPI000BCBD0A6|nr:MULTISPECIES: NUDIX hydrolase [Acidiphilium]OYW02067.1 MAG: phosphohydrolase [Acidiphilium sp. 37-64-53]OZB30570.1 MAG: phosphohydrolase [Acidiphilium sp. 34-64-41]HQT84638.1 NUDIX hydrolase [Acidiphilium rubrum]